ncbi:DMT family transporter [Flavobacterium wongokense]|uniref:DMT family transporter n=1 Tax=Flavobacterium wongokense TaxID=2910674 RepID=UPI001F39255B|nr:DMT family transporter [Flavobacterium sp. WG47]MCF6132900.1 DMT family transporter [Flavobacterium sp. WG47]
MKSNLIYLAMALITGALIPIQASTNAAFSKSVGNPFLTGLMVFIVGLIGMVAFIVISGTAMPTTQQVISAPLYSYLGGVIVVIYVIMISVLVPRIGVGTSIAFILTGQVIFAVIIDHFGLFNVVPRSINFTRIIGLVLLISGVYIVMKK